jgi:signal transduction histidine kinase
VELSCRLLSNKQWSIAIADTGVGILLEEQQRVIEICFRASFTSGDRLPDITSLRLAIVLQLVKLMQGDIKIVSLLRVSSTFTVIFPIKIKTS